MGSGTPPSVRPLRGGVGPRDTDALASNSPNVLLSLQGNESEHSSRYRVKFLIGANYNTDCWQISPSDITFSPHHFHTD